MGHLFFRWRHLTSTLAISLPFVSLHEDPEHASFHRCGSLRFVSIHFDMFLGVNSWHVILVQTLTVRNKKTKNNKIKKQKKQKTTDGRKTFGRSDGRKNFGRSDERQIFGGFLYHGDTQKKRLKKVK